MPVPAFDSLSHFIATDMRMSHIYQPVMLSVLLSSGGRATVEEIASALLARDRAQLDYYKEITRQMPGAVLRKRDVVRFEAGIYILPAFDEMTNAERLQLVTACEAKVEAFLQSRSDPWLHRRKASGYVPGTMRYEVLKRASFRCELCGVGADEKALEVDHIVPRNKGGTDAPENLQALCYSCNATKRDRDDTDFRGMGMKYAHRQEGCVFCEVPRGRLVAENSLAFAIHDAYPVTDGHTLLIPKRHLQSSGDLVQPELNGLWALQGAQRAALLTSDPTIRGFNFGLNDGEAAGQTVNHCHFHLIPRRAGDVADPGGGIRGVIPEKQRY
jgi:ATP adenylyltransferase